MELKDNSAQEGVVEKALRHTRLARLAFEGIIVERFGDEKYFEVFPLLEQITELEIKIEQILFPVPVNDTYPPLEKYCTGTKFVN
jgi:hypothetical protein